MTSRRAAKLASALLAWYDRHRRQLPWRAPPGERMSPYRVWLSEIMLQQTTVAAVRPYFERFVARWPTVADLAAADIDEVMRLWAGLGYYARARNMHKCAQVITSRFDGAFPDTRDDLIDLPGIGPYTAAAIAAIAFDRAETPVDGNVERVMARLFDVRTPLPAAKPELRLHAAALTPKARAGDYAQAVMDLGATVCTPHRPNCPICPWQAACRARTLGIEATLPRRAPKTTKPGRHGVAYWIERPDGAVLLRRRPPRGLLGGMLEVPSSDWRDRRWTAAAARAAAPFAGNWHAVPGVVRHGFTHFDLEMKLYATGLADGAAGLDGIWCLPDQFGDHGLPSLMRKVVAHALKARAR